MVFYNSQQGRHFGKHAPSLILKKVKKNIFGNLT